MKWLWIILLLIVGIIAAVFAIEYFTVGIGHLPSWIPGHSAAIAVGPSGKCPKDYHLSGSLCHKSGHMRKAGAISALIAVIAFVGAGWLIYKNQQAKAVAAAAGTV